MCVNVVSLFMFMSLFVSLFVGLGESRTVSMCRSVCVCVSFYLVSSGQLFKATYRW